MKYRSIALILPLFSLLAMPAGATETLIVADEFPAMRVLAEKLQKEEQIGCQIVSQTNLPASFASFSAVLVYIHRDLADATELALIQYAQAGGKLIVLHHSISSGKRKNRQWFRFLGVELPGKNAASAEYRYAEDITLDIVNLAPTHFITAYHIQYPAEIEWPGLTGTLPSRKIPGFILTNSEVYLNHVLTGPRTLLLGLRYQDKTTGEIYCQNHAGWVKPAEQGWIIYLMPGHSSLDFENPTYARIVLNAIVASPKQLAGN